MEWYDFVVWGVAGAAALGLLVMIARRFPKVASIDLKAMPKHKLRERKSSMIEQRLARKVSNAKDVATKSAAPVGDKVKGAAKRWYNKVQALELKYRTPKNGKPETGEQKEITRQRLQDLMRQGEDMMKEENWVEAEKKFIEVVSLDPQFTDAYKRLGKVYVEMKDAEYAIETLEFAKKLAPQDDDVYYVLGVAYQEIGNPEKALQNLKKATMLVKRNPKYLDALIEAAIAKNDKFEAEHAWETLKEVNPENQKLSDFRKRIDEIETVGPADEKEVETVKKDETK